MRKLTAVLLSAFLFVQSVSAEMSDAATEVETETAAVSESVESGESEVSDGKILGGLLMIGSLISAACISTLIFKGRDKTKYL